eukprot:4989181-Pleurochrysis_carterae.AAC.1
MPGHAVTVCIVLLVLLPAVPLDLPRAAGRAACCRSCYMLRVLLRARRAAGRAASCAAGACCQRVRRAAGHAPSFARRARARLTARASRPSLASSAPPRAARAHRLASPALCSAGICPPLMLGGSRQKAAGSWSDAASGLASAHRYSQTCTAASGSAANTRYGQSRMR